MADAPKLKPCPWCRKDNNLGYDETQGAVMCFDCLSAGPEKTSEAEAIAAWNVRADLIDMDVLRRVEAALKDSFGISRAQERISKAALTDLRAMMEKINE